jgi:hypothetical protein
MATPFTILPFVAFVAVANPATYKAVRSVAGNWVSNAEGRATFPGLLLHALVFVILVSLLMRFVKPRLSGFELGMSDLSDIPTFDIQMNAMHPTDEMPVGMAPLTAAVPAPAPMGSDQPSWYATLLKNN